MKKYTSLSPQEKTRRRHSGQPNFVYVRYADDFVVLSNGTKEQAGQHTLKAECFAQPREAGPNQPFVIVHKLLLKQKLKKPKILVSDV